MLSVRGDSTVPAIPVVVLAIAALDAAIFAYALSLEPGELAAWMDRWGLVPREFLRGAGAPSSTRQVAWLTPFTSMFLHGNLLHLAGNLLYLWIFGSALEPLLGRPRFVTFYLACGLAAALVQVASDPSAYVPTVGASGAISGLLGAWAVSHPTSRLRLVWPPVRVPAYLFLAAWVAIQLLSALSGGDGVAWWAHLGGFAAGAALARSMGQRRPTRSRVRI